MNRKTLAFYVFIVVQALIYEGLALAGYFGDTATISETWWWLNKVFPLWNLLVGVLIGHFVWQRGKCRNCGERPS